ERKKSEETIYHLAYHDTLTDLPNRRLFMDRLRKEVQLAKRSQMQLAIMFIDLDRFKNINDTLGHEAGDLILIEVSKRISACIDADDIVARLGGDEFIVLLSNINDATDVEAVSRKLQENFEQPFKLSGQYHTISTSIGIALYPTDGRDSHELMKRADM